MNRKERNLSFSEGKNEIWTLVNGKERNLDFSEQEIKKFELS